MSIDNPNEYEKAIEDYADAVRNERDAIAAAKLANQAEVDARQVRQASWRVISGMVNQGHIKPGVYRINKGPGMFAEAVLIETHHDYPDLFPMFR